MAEAIKLGCLQVLQYLDGQKYSSHFDYFHDTVSQALAFEDRCVSLSHGCLYSEYRAVQINTANGGQRVGTVLMYLTDVEEGGETVFPSSLGHSVCNILLHQ